MPVVPARPHAGLPPGLRHFKCGILQLVILNLLPNTCWRAIDTGSWFQGRLAYVSVSQNEQRRCGCPYNKDLVFEVYNGVLLFRERL